MRIASLAVNHRSVAAIYIYSIYTDLCHLCGQVVMLIWGRYDSGRFDHGGTF